MVDFVKMKVCKKCNKKKELEEYHKGTGTLGRHSHCKDCRKLAAILGPVSDSNN